MPSIVTSSWLSAICPWPPNIPGKAPWLTIPASFVYQAGYGRRRRVALLEHPLAPAAGLEDQVAGRASASRTGRRSSGRRSGPRSRPIIDAPSDERRMADGVDLVDEDDALAAPLGGEPLRLPRHVADDQHIDADEGLSESRARDRDERAVESGRDRLREHRLAGAGRAVEEDAALAAAAGQLERLAGLPEADDPPDLLLRLRLAADVLELDAPVGVAGLEAFDLRDAHHHHRAHQDQEVEDEEERQDDQLAQERGVPEPVLDAVPDRGRGPPPGHVAAEDPLDEEDDRDEADEPERDPVPEAPEPVAPPVEDVLLAHLVARRARTGSAAG